MKATLSSVDLLLFGGCMNIPLSGVIPVTNMMYPCDGYYVYFC